MKKIILFILIAAVIALGAWYVLKLYNETSEPTPVAVETDARETVRVTLHAMDPNDVKSLEKIQDIIDLKHDAVEPLAGYVQSENPLEQWVAVVGLAAVRDELEDQTAITSLMKEAYDSRFLTIALFAANSNAKFGYYSGLPLVLDALESDEITLYMDPPQRTSKFAAAILQSVSGENYGFSAAETPTEKTQAIAKWRAWWEVFRGVEGL